MAECKCDCEGKGGDVIYGMLLLSLALMAVFLVGLAYTVASLKNQTEELKGMVNLCERKTALLWTIASHEGKLKGKVSNGSTITNTTHQRSYWQ